MSERIVMLLSVRDARTQSVHSAASRRARACPGQAPGSLRGRRLPAQAREGVVEAHARADPELREHLLQVPFDRARAEEELRADLRVRPAVASPSRDEVFLGRQLVARLVDALAHLRAGGQQLVAGAMGESIRAHRDQHVVRGAQLYAGIDAALLAAEPLAVEEV